MLQNFLRIASLLLVIVSFQQVTLSQEIEFPTDEIWQWGDTEKSWSTGKKDVIWNPQYPVFAATDLASILIWKPLNDTPNLNINLVDNSSVGSDVEWLPDGERIAVLTYGDSQISDHIKLFETTNGYLVGDIHGREHVVGRDPRYFGAYRFDWNLTHSDLVASNGYDVRIWHVNLLHNTAELQILWEYNSLASALEIEWSPDGEMFAAAGIHQTAREDEPEETANPDNNTIRIWDKDGNFIRMLGTSAYVSWSPDGRYIAGGDKNLTVWDVETGDIMFEAEERGGVNGDGLITDVAWRADGQVIATATADSLGLLSTPATIWLWDATSGNLLGQLNGHMILIYEIAWSPDNQYLVSVSLDGTTRIWGNP